MIRGRGSVRDLLRADPLSLFESPPLDRHPTDAHPGVASREAAERAMRADGAVLSELGERLYAERTRSLLLVLQGMDTSGKGGVIEHVVGEFNPLGCRITAFKAPTPAELRHHFLWRIRRALPPAGHIGIFDRSHYEDVLVVRVRRLAPQAVWEPRFAQINRFEERLVATGTTVVKCLLHISAAEQRQRLLDRLDDPDKLWKFRAGDLDDRAHWAAYQKAYADIVRRCSSGPAPWYVIPADRKWYRNWAVGRILVETLTEMDPRYPPRPDLDVEALRARLTRG